MHSILLQKCYDLVCLVSRLTTAFPKKDRHGLGIDLDFACLQLLEAVLEIEQTLPALKDRALISASVKNKCAGLLCRIAMEHHLIRETNYFRVSGLTTEIGKLIGGWCKSTHV